MRERNEGPPARWERALQILLPPLEAEVLLGDLAEDWAHWARTEGRRSADRRYGRHARATLLRRGVATTRRSASESVRAVRLTARSLARSPGHALTGALTLGLGMGGTAAIGALAFSVLRPLPFPEADRLVAVWETRHGEQRWVAPANYLDWRRELTSFSSLAAHDRRSVSITVDGRAERGRVAMVSGNFFEVLGTVLPLGAGFDPELAPDFPERVAVLSHSAWRDRFGSDPGVLDRSLVIDDATYRIVGVAPAGLGMPEEGLTAWLRSRYEAPELGIPGAELRSLRDAWYFEVVGRLAPGVTIDRARAELADLTARLEQTYPESNAGHRAEVIPLLDQTVADARPIVGALVAAMLLLLGASLVNLTHLALGRRAARRTEDAVRQALGAGRHRLAGQALGEGALIGVAGGLTGLFLGSVALRAAGSVLGPTLSRSTGAVLGPAAMVGLLVLAIASGATVSGLAWRFDRRARARQGVGNARAFGAGQGGWLVAAQVAAAVALLACSSVLGRSLHRLSAVDLGFDQDRVVTASVAQPDARQHAYSERLQTWETLRARLAALPEFATVSMSATTPLSMGLQAGLRVEGWTGVGEPGNVGWHPVHADYFDAYGLGLVEGRLLESTDGADGTQVAVVNETLARSVFGPGSAVGRMVSIGLDGHDRPITIVGVVEDSRTRGPALAPGPVMYRPLEQTTRFSAESIVFVARVAEARPGQLRLVRQTVQAVRPDLPVYAERLGPELVDGFVGARSAVLGVLLVFAVVTLLLGAVGVYGVAATGVARRRREIGVRMALGADAGRVRRGIVAHGLRQASWGMPIGLGLALLVSGGLSGLLFEVSRVDPISILVAAGVVLLTTAAALWQPAWTASRVPPADATRGS